MQRARRSHPAALRVVTGDADVAPLEEIYRRYAPYVARVVLRLSGRSAEVEDMVHDVFVEATRGLGGLRQPDAVKGWLGTIAVRLVRRRLRLRRMRRLLGLEGAVDQHDQERELEELADRSASAADRVLLAAVYRVLDGMPSADRLAWSLHYLEGETVEAVSRLCSCSCATSKRRIARVQTRIVERLRDE